MFMFHIALALNLLVLVAGSALFLFAASRCDCKGSCFAKLVAIIAILFSILSIACTMNSGMKIWQDMKADGKVTTTEMSTMMADPAAPNAEKASTAKVAKPAHHR